MRLGLKWLLFLIFPDFVIIPRLKTHITTYNCNYLTCIRHFVDSLFSILTIVLDALIKTLSHVYRLNRDVEGLKSLLLEIYTFERIIIAAILDFYISRLLKKELPCRLQHHNRVDGGLSCVIV